MKQHVRVSLAYSVQRSLFRLHYAANWLSDIKANSSVADLSMCSSGACTAWPTDGIARTPAAPPRSTGSNKPAQPAKRVAREK
eukprot:7300775-Lingulodinium_polyedra.AAC.1